MKNEYYRYALVIVLIISLLLLGFENINMLTGKVTLSTSSDITINSFIAMAFSSELQAGIIFEEINFLPADNVTAQKNYDAENKTEYYVIVSNDSNSEMDLCMKAAGNLLNAGLDVIGIGNESYSSSLESNETLPSLLNETSFSFVYDLAGGDIPIGGQNNLRFWLDVPAGQASGTYNNSIYFKGIISGLGC